MMPAPIATGSWAKRPDLRAGAYRPAVSSTLVNSATSAKRSRCRSDSPLVASASSISSGLKAKLTISDPFDGNTSSPVTSGMVVVPYLCTTLYARRSNEAFERMRLFASMFSDAIRQGGRVEALTKQSWRPLGQSKRELISRDRELLNLFAGPRA